LKIKGNDLISSKQCKTFEEATDLAVETLRRQLKKLKDKKTSKVVSINKLDKVKETDDIEDIMEDIE
jgi:putative sigma-54 modulation protein